MCYTEGQKKAIAKEKELFLNGIATKTSATLELANFMPVEIAEATVKTWQGLKNIREKNENS
jgi:hypothetical protein